MLSRVLEARLKAAKRSVLLLGARQVGKSTLIRALNPDRSINLADETTYLAYAKDPGRLRRELAAITRPTLVACALSPESQTSPSMPTSSSWASRRRR